MKGAEYLSPDLLEVLWREMETHFQRGVKDSKGTLKSYVAAHYPTWHTIGRVCFHLAENKRSEETPFAFLATYTTRLSDKQKAQHLPLGRALELYSGEKNKSALLNLLIPIRHASEKSELVRELLESGDLYHALVWTPSEAHRFLKDIPVFEASGVMVRVPDWWNAKKPPRPEVSVRIGDTRPAALGADAMLDFSIELTLGGKKLSPREYEELLSKSIHSNLRRFLHIGRRSKKRRRARASPFLTGCVFYPGRMRERWAIAGHRALIGRISRPVVGCPNPWSA
jgi:non-specific serine/threonine protein kinase